MSKGLARAKTISTCNKKNSCKRVSEWRGSGGCCGKYNGLGGVSGKFGIQNCAEYGNHNLLIPQTNDPKEYGGLLVKPSVRSFRGMMATRNRWVKLNIKNFSTDAELEKNGIPRTNAWQAICNNWVQDIGSNQFIETKTQGQYISDRITPLVSICNPQNLSDVPRPGQKIPNVYDCQVCSKPCRSCSHYIGGRFVPPTPFSKQTTYIPPASFNLNKVKARYGILPNTGFNARWPSDKSTFSCMSDIYSASNKNLIEKRILEELAIRNENGICTNRFLENYKKILSERSCN